MTTATKLADPQKRRWYQYNRYPKGQGYRTFRDWQGVTKAMRTLC